MDSTAVSCRVTGALANIVPSANFPRPSLLPLDPPVYLLLLVSAVLVFLSDVLLETELCLFPLNHAVYYYYSYTRSIERIKVDTWRTEDDADAGIYFHLPPYVRTGCLFILGVTLFLFFASGMYSERVGYANKYVSPHRYLDQTNV